MEEEMTTEELTICAECEHYIKRRWWLLWERCDIPAVFDYVLGIHIPGFCDINNAYGHCPDFKRKPKRAGWWARLTRR
jgi:hypothetical protein